MTYEFTATGGTYTIEWPLSGGMPAWEMADWTDTLVRFMVMLREDDPRLLTDSNVLYDAMNAAYKLGQAGEALRDALIRTARRSVDGKPVMTFDEIGKALGVQRSTVKARHDRLEAGEQARYAHWLAGTLPDYGNLEPGYEWSADVLTLADPAGMYAMLLDDTSEAAAVAATKIRERLHDPATARTDWPVAAEINLIRAALPAEVLADPDADRAIELAARGLYVLRVLYPDPAETGRAGLIVGELERPEYRALATYHHAGGALAAIGVLVRQLTGVDASTGDILDAVAADMWSDAVYGNGRRSDSPYGHDERRSADLVQAHALALGLGRERAARLWSAVMGTTFDETTKAQMGATDPDIVVQAVAGADLHVLATPESTAAAMDLAIENLTSARFRPERHLGHVLAAAGIRSRSVPEILAWVDAHPDTRPVIDGAEQDLTVREMIGKALYFNAAFVRDHHYPETWRLDDQEQRERNAELQARLGSQLMAGEITATEAYRIAQAAARGEN
ncbi:hypothetical protein [Nocardia sp. NPDC127526]|uniref:hypothetical protein n=1 Tax=Nocardia sp. NPDC127526 TaxID=3345393 RepID=UPI00362F4896